MNRANGITNRATISQIFDERKHVAYITNYITNFM